MTLNPRPLRSVALALGLLALAWAVAAATQAPQWQPWSPDVLEQARQGGRLVLIDLAADWCAACRKMDETGFRDPRVLGMLEGHYVAVRADIDRDGELSRRFGGLGVPALVILDDQGKEIIARRGYLEPDWLYWMLVAVADNPDPEAHR